MSKLLTAEQWESFRWRVWNTLKSIVLPIVLGIILLDLNSTPNDLSGLFHEHLWIEIGYAVLVALIGSGLTGLDKVMRMKTEVNVEQERVADLKK